MLHNEVNLFWQNEVKNVRHRVKETGGGINVWRRIENQNEIIYPLVNKETSSPIRLEELYTFTFCWSGCYSSLQSYVTITSLICYTSGAKDISEGNPLSQEED